MPKVLYYILFNGYEEALSAREALNADSIPNRIAPAPYALLGEVQCGVSLLLEDGVQEAAKNCLDTHEMTYHAIVAYDGGLNPHRDTYC